jgi:hypothetical protein
MTNGEAALSNSNSHSNSQAQDAAFFVFPELSALKEVSYRLTLTLFEVVGQSAQR